MTSVEKEFVERILSRFTESFGTLEITLEKWAGQSKACSFEAKIMLQKDAGEDTISTTTKHQMNSLPLLVTWHWHWPLLTLATRWPSCYSCDCIPEVTAMTASVNSHCQYPGCSCALPAREWSLWKLVSGFGASAAEGRNFTGIGREFRCQGAKKKKMTDDFRTNPRILNYNMSSFLAIFSFKV